MIAISAYTEPVPVAVNELPQTQESEEQEESSSFAELLAGILRNSEKNQDILPVDFSDDINAGSFFIEDADNGESLNLLGSIKVIDEPELHFSDTKIPDENLNTLISAAHLVAGSAETEIIDDMSDFQQQISNLIVLNNLPEAGLDSDFFMIEKPVKLNAEVSQVIADNDNVNSGDDLPGKAGKKKERLFNDKSEEGLLPKVENDAAKETKNDRNYFLNNNENRGRLDEMRSRSRRDKIAFEVRDLRTDGANTQNSSHTRPYSAIEAAAGRVSGEAPVREITLELRLPDNGSVMQNQAQTTWEARASNALENMLARELHQNLNGDIVRHASMALRDGGETTIRLALKPENLGNVKIRLEMSENKITGQIIVESKEALNAFRTEIASLEEAFRESGFTNANLNLSLTADGRDAEGWEQELNSFTPRMIASLYDESYEKDAVNVVDFLIERKVGSINMLA